MDVLFLSRRDNVDSHEINLVMRSAVEPLNEEQMLIVIEFFKEMKNGTDFLARALADWKVLYFMSRYARLASVIDNPRLKMLVLQQLGCCNTKLHKDTLTVSRVYSIPCCKKQINKVRLNLLCYT